MIKTASSASLAFLLALASPPAWGQTPAFEYGSSADLRGVTKIFVDTGDDLEARENIIRIITRELPFLTVTARPSEAEVILAFRTGESTEKAGTYSSGAAEAVADVQPSGEGAEVTADARTDELTLAIYQTTVTGSGRVFRLVDGGRVRLIMTFQGTKIKGTIWKKPRTKFAEKFVSEYKKGQSGS